MIKKFMLWYAKRSLQRVREALDDTAVCGFDDIKNLRDLEAEWEEVVKSLEDLKTK